MVLMLYRIRNGLIAILAAAYLEPVLICTRRFKTRYVQIQCNTATYGQTFFHACDVKISDSVYHDVL